MKFPNPETALSWYFNKSWQRKPAKAKSLDPIKVQSSFRQGDLAGDVQAHLKIESILNQHIKPRDCVILRNEFSWNGASQTSLAETFELSGDRSIRKIKERSIKKLEKLFQISELLFTPKYEVPTYAHG